MPQRGHHSVERWPEVEPAPLVDEPEEAPDVLDVRVGEREVVVPPVHPLAEPDRALRQLLRRPDDDLAAPAGELREPVLLDLALRVEPELALDADLDPEALAVEAVLVALVEAAQRLVALEDVLERPAPGRVDGERLVRRDRPVDEAEARAVRDSARAGPRRSAPAPRASRTSSSSAGWSGMSGSGAEHTSILGTGRPGKPRAGAAVNVPGRLIHAGRPGGEDDC